MAEKTVKLCDVFGTCRHIRRFEVVVAELTLDETATPCHRVVSTEVKDLSPRALKRLLYKIDQGCKPPPKRETTAEE